MAALKTLRIASGEAGDKLVVAGRFLETARTALAESDYDAAILTAVRAGMSAAEALTVAVKGERWIDPDPEGVIDLLVDVRRCGAWRATAKGATQAVKQAERIVEWANAVALGAGSTFRTLKPALKQQKRRSRQPRTAASPTASSANVVAGR